MVFAFGADSLLLRLDSDALAYRLGCTLVFLKGTPSLCLAGWRSHAKQDSSRGRGSQSLLGG